MFIDVDHFELGMEFSAEFFRSSCISANVLKVASILSYIILFGFFSEFSMSWNILTNPS